MDKYCDFCGDVYAGAVWVDMMKKGFKIICAGRVLDMTAGPVIMGIVNTTPDSFYDGGAFGCNVDLGRAFDAAVSMIGAGASIVDVGGESSRPGAEVISVDEEIRRTAPLIGMLRERTDVLISIDTYKAAVAEAALRAGAHLVNDISGFTFDEKLPAVCRRYGAGVILMHTQIRPGAMGWSRGFESEGTDIVTRVKGFLRESVARAQAHLIDDIIVDPGFGFGKSVEENFRLLRELGSLLELGRPVLAGVSRKSFLGYALAGDEGEVPPPAERLAASVAAGTIALCNGASILRVHDVGEAVQSLKIVLSTEY